MYDVHENASVQNLVHLFRRAGDDRAIAPQDDGSIHDFGMLQEKPHERIWSVVVIDVKTQLPERARMNQILWLAREQLQKSPQFRLARRSLQILDNVELDVAVAQDFQRAV